MQKYTSHKSKRQVLPASTIQKNTIQHLVVNNFTLQHIQVELFSD
jgi:hypothetical protein